MKTTMRLILFLVTICFVTFALCSCSHEGITATKSDGSNSSVAQNVTAPQDQGVTNHINYSTYTFWEKPNEIKLIMNLELNIKDDVQITPSGDFMELSDSYTGTVERLKEGIIDFLITNYRLDATKKLNSQEIRVKDFAQTSTEMFTLGCADKKNPKVIWLNTALFTDEYSFLFEQIYVHETLHFLGVQGQDDGLLHEGITDALTDKILTSMGLVFYETEAYNECRVLAYQILEVDNDVVRLYLTDKNFCLKNRITDRLSGIKYSIEQCDDPGQQLINLLLVVYNWRNGLIDYDMFPLVYDAQEIVHAYCKTFNPNHKQIDYIRAHYLVDNFEKFSPEMYWIDRQINAAA